MDLIETLAANLNADVRTCPTCEDIVIGDSPYGLCGRCRDRENLMSDLELAAFYSGEIARICHICDTPSLVTREQDPCHRCKGKGCK